MARKPFKLVEGAVVPGTKWRLVSELARGGMGVTWYVEKPPGIRGVMKLILPELASTGSYVRRFLDEVAILTQLDHPNIVKVFDFDILEDGTPFFVMERLQGKTLGRATKTVSKATGQKIVKALPARIAYEITRQVCEALYRAHSFQPKGVVHRDLKPDNVFIHDPGFGADPVVKLLDFGVAAFEEAKRESGPVGTPRYMAPEQLRCEDITFKADLYAMGLVLYEMLTGRGPFDDRLPKAGPNERVVALVRAHLHDEPPPPSRFAPWIPTTIDALVLSALEKDPAARPVSAYALVAKLYELQFVNDGTPRAVVDANTTAPTLVRLTEDDEDAGAPNAAAPSPPPGGGATAPLNDTLREEIPVAAIVHTAKMNADAFASTTPKMDPVSQGIDRNASTRLSPIVAAKPRLARHDTEPMASRELRRSSSNDETRRAPDTSAAAPEPEATPLTSELSSAASSLGTAETPLVGSSTSAGLSRSSSLARAERSSGVKLVVAILSASLVAAAVILFIGHQYRRALAVAPVSPPSTAQEPHAFASAPEAPAPAITEDTPAAAPRPASPAPSASPSARAKQASSPSSPPAPLPLKSAPARTAAAPPKAAPSVPSARPPGASRDDLMREM